MTFACPFRLEYGIVEGLSTKDKTETGCERREIARPSTNVDAAQATIPARGIYS